MQNNHTQHPNIIRKIRICYVQLAKICLLQKGFDLNNKPKSQIRYALLRVEMLYGGEILINAEYKEVLFGGNLPRLDCFSLGLEVKLWC